MMEASPSAPFIVVEPELALQFLVVPFDAPADLRQPHQVLKGDVLGHRREPVLRRRRFVAWPLNQQPFDRAGFVAALFTSTSIRPQVL